MTKRRIAPSRRYAAGEVGYCRVVYAATADELKACSEEMFDKVFPKGMPEYYEPKSLNRKTYEFARSCNFAYSQSPRTGGL